MTTIYIECTNTYATEVLSGIQRVVKKVVQAAADPGNLPDDTRVVPIILKNNRFQVIDALPDHHYEKAQQANKPTRLAKWRQHVRNAPRLLIKRLMQSARFEDVKNNIRAHFPQLFAWLKRQYVNLKFYLQSTKSDTATLHFKQGDILFMLDSSWHVPIWDAVNAAKAEGATVIFAAYDLIPISHPTFCDEHLVTMFAEFYRQAVRTASGFIAISASVRDTVRDYLQSVNPEAASRLAFEFFHLGADFSQQQLQSASVRNTLQDVLSADQGNSYLIVSTIEPRKNHAYLLDAFDRLWEQGIRANLIIVGRVGWKVDALMQRLLTHPQLNQQLFLFHDLTDAELSYCYTHARALVFPSVIEGFGLPIIEALQHGLPVIASDIPVHREIGGNLVYYVDLASEHALVQQLMQIDAEGIDTAHQVTADYHWLSWQEATKILLHKLVQMQQKIANEQSLHTH